MRVAASAPVGHAVGAANRVGSETADRAQRDGGIGAEIGIVGGWSDGGEGVEGDDEDEKGNEKVFSGHDWN